MNIPDFLALKIIQNFQGFCVKNKNYSNEYQINQFLNKKLKLKTDVKTLINLSETNKFFHYLIRKSEFAKIIWLAYYNSLFDSKSRESVHIGNFCGNKCLNPSHYIDIKHKTRIKWSIDEIFKKIAIKNFSILKGSTDFSDYHELKLNNLRYNKECIDEEINKLENKKRISKLSLDSIFDYWMRKS